MPDSAEEIENKIFKINHFIEELEPLFKKRKPDDVLVKIRFPRGVIRKTETYRSRVTLIKNPILKTNMAYSLQLANVFTWILNWIDIVGIVKEMLIKHGIVLFVSVMEALVHYFVDNYLEVDVHKRLKRNLKKLLDAQVIDEEEHDDFNSCRFTRDSIHLQNLGKRELEKYEESDYYFVMDCLNKINRKMLKYLKEKK